MTLQIPTTQLNALYEAISGHMPLYLPIEATGVVEFKPWQAGTKVRLDKLHTNRSPKDFFFPDVENIASFQNHKNQIAIEDMRRPGQPFALFGVRACDAAGLDILDKVFLGDTRFVDSFYETRRENGVVITAACLQPEETCFCTAFAIDPLNPAGDVATWLTGDTLYWLAVTEKGRALTDHVRPLFETADDTAPLEAAKTAAHGVFMRLP
ncbi:MAG: 4Fe-4S ferredoxin, partial [Defluviitaleaceae bacterium]|nr:4Fe-4S ferredoxin [Defluviitaleaceae bacterium]